MKSGAQPPLLWAHSVLDNIEPVLRELGMLGMCEQVGQAPCEKCRSCRLVKSGVHPEVIDYAPSKKTWAIKEFRALFDRISTTALTARRLVIIRDIDTTSLPAANVLLKSLEEPSATTRFILTTAWPTRLLPTIRSRCYQVRFHTTSEAPPENASLELPLNESLTPATVAHIAAYLRHELATKGPTPQLRRAFLRLRDYYVITGKRGNEKLAGEVLTLSLP